MSVKILIKVVLNVILPNKIIFDGDFCEQLTKNSTQIIMFPQK